MRKNIKKMIRFFIFSCFLVGVCVVDADIIRAVREKINEVKSSANIKQCFTKMLVCGGSVNVRIVEPEINENGMTIREETLNSMCSAGAQFLPCVTTPMFPGERCELFDLLQDQYNFMCITNRSDVVDLFECANKKLVQTKAFGCNTFLYAALFSADWFQKDKNQGSFKKDVINRWYCRVFNSVKNCLQWSVSPECERKDANTLMSLVNDNLINTIVNNMPSLVSNGDNIGSFNISACPSTY
ncbi:hypothetical protein KUTeg_001939 [Tegillarca granosa]|uniref:DUF19 domain-containing protein n=1 Tax=Tegillarca granosa TaxID=220873 RepID=A0ABQ9FWJ0_TEGGR|nr:hypothetical protein KUTeg_001939 [Tegillarca granosa]